ncbi:uncharacterized protein BYT42DRAFT_559196 [Radiomyces spectabilis]|uniref:uncharacterized protein n=1 Tax=Radiomyces spectabilis TaxID=64574 RepID=UPI002220D5E2|nr:uncharacterized protein BYT42DRAFT_559196 [Radiomyces spectabilis]KAI8388189.1 hypothetical protein BYT42DRAFT_559196 [Radiomyces spectabilis]
MLLGSSSRPSSKDISMATVLLEQQLLLRAAVDEMSHPDFNRTEVRKFLALASQYNGRMQELYPYEDHTSESNWSTKRPRPTDEGSAERAFIDKFKRDIVARTGHMNWNVCLAHGRAQGLFHRFLAGQSLRQWNQRRK